MNGKYKGIPLLIRRQISRCQSRAFCCWYLVSNGGSRGLLTFLCSVYDSLVTTDSIQYTQFNTHSCCIWKIAKKLNFKNNLTVNIRWIISQLLLPRVFHWIRVQSLWVHNAIGNVSTSTLPFLTDWQLQPNIQYLDVDHWIRRFALIYVQLPIRDGGDLLASS